VAARPDGGSSPPIGSIARAGLPARSPTSSPMPSRRYWPARSSSSSAWARASARRR